MLLLQIALAALVLYGLWMACRPRPVFLLRIVHGVPRVARGTVTQAFVQEVAEVCRRHHVQKGAVRGFARDRRIALEFSGAISAPCRQQLRNLWAISGWSAAPSRAGRSSS